MLWNRRRRDELRAKQALKSQRMSEAQIESHRRYRDKLSG